MPKRAEINLKEFVGPEQAEWYLMTPQERMDRSAKLMNVYIALGGSLEPEHDSQSPFQDPDQPVKCSFGFAEVIVDRFHPFFRRAVAV